MVSSNDFSAFALFTAGLATLASAATPANTATNPSGNPFSAPALNAVVPAGSPFTVQWNPTTAGTVTIWLCKGPSTNCVIQPAPIADTIANSGTFSWTPSTSLEATGNSGYGLQIVSDTAPTTGQYQYTAQFGISNPSYSGSSSSASASASASASYSASASASAPSGYSSTTSCSTSGAPYPTGNSTVYAPTSYGTALPTYGESTGVLPSTVVQPTGTLSVPSTLYTAPAGTSPATSPRPSSAAGSKYAGFGGAALGAVIAAFAL